MLPRVRARHFIVSLAVGTFRVNVPLSRGRRSEVPHLTLPSVLRISGIFKFPVLSFIVREVATMLLYILVVRSRSSLVLSSGTSYAYAPVRAC
jgi:hypothetical protein